jgi:hypothetical protein
MNRNLESALAVGISFAAAFVAVAAISSTNAHADDITIDKTPFVSSRSRAEVQAELMGQPQLVTAAASEWSMQFKQAPQLKSAYTSEQAKAEYKVSRQYVSALTGEDSGSAYFIKSAVPLGASAAATMGGPAR